MILWTWRCPVMGFISVCPGPQELFFTVPASQATPSVSFLTVWPVCSLCTSSHTYFPVWTTRESTISFRYFTLTGNKTNSKGRCTHLFAFGVEGALDMNAFGNLYLQKIVCIISWQIFQHPPHTNTHKHVGVVLYPAPQMMMWSCYCVSYRIAATEHRHLSEWKILVVICYEGHITVTMTDLRSSLPTWLSVILFLLKHISGSHI